jgi:hypothetical protein
MDVQSSTCYYRGITLREQGRSRPMATATQVQHAPVALLESERSTRVRHKPEELLEITDRPMPELIDGQLVERIPMGQ